MFHERFSTTSREIFHDFPLVGRLEKSPGLGSLMEDLAPTLLPEGVEMLVLSGIMSIWH